MNSVGYLPDGTPLNRAGNAINHPAAQMRLIGTVQGFQVWLFMGFGLGTSLDYVLCEGSSLIVTRTTDPPKPSCQIRNRPETLEGSFKLRSPKP